MKFSPKSYKHILKRKNVFKAYFWLKKYQKWQKLDLFLGVNALISSVNIYIYVKFLKIIPYPLLNKITLQNFTDIR